ncbi:MAG: hypothetical protein WCJ30_05395, partial [Deltaproteobacteria bacterium]
PTWGRQDTGPRRDAGDRPRPAAGGPPRKDAPPWARPSGAPPRRDTPDRPRPAGPAAPRSDSPPWARRDDRPASHDTRGVRGAPAPRDDRAAPRPPREPAAPRGGSDQGGIQRWNATESSSSPIDIARAKRAAARTHDAAPAAPAKGPRDAAYGKPSTWERSTKPAGGAGRPAKPGKFAKAGPTKRPKR